MNSQKNYTVEKNPKRLFSDPSASLVRSSKSTVKYDAKEQKNNVGMENTYLAQSEKKPHLIRFFSFRPGKILRISLHSPNSLTYKTFSHNIRNLNLTANYTTPSARTTARVTLASTLKYSSSWVTGNFSCATAYANLLYLRSCRCIWRGRRPTQAFSEKAETNGTGMLSYNYYFLCSLL